MPDVLKTLLDRSPVGPLGTPGAKSRPDADIVAYCRGLYSIFAHQAVAALRKHGLNAWRLEGELPEWRAKGWF